MLALPPSTGAAHMRRAAATHCSSHCRPCPPAAGQRAPAGGAHGPARRIAAAVARATPKRGPSGVACHAGPSPSSTSSTSTSSTSSGSASSSASSSSSGTVPVEEGPGVLLRQWLADSGAEVGALQLRSVDMQGVGRPLDLVVAARQLRAGDVALRVPDAHVVTLDRVFESAGLAEMLTAGKLSELACLALYMMYEKKAAESPLLWSEAELHTLLQGSPVVAAVEARLEGMRREYAELDAVWFMAGSLFNRYPFDPPTEAFTFDLFKQAFAAVQASVVHLQGVQLARRFALVPLGPPLLAYSSTCKALLAHNKALGAVELVVDRDYAPVGEPVYAWCGPQPNRNLLINYGIVDESNPYDRLTLTVTLDSADPLFKLKRGVLQDQGLSTMQAFDLTRATPLPPQLLPFMRLAHAASESQVAQVSFDPAAAAPLDTGVEQAVACQLAQHLRGRLAAYPHSLAHDLEVLQDASANPRAKVAARLTKIEKSILSSSVEAVEAATPCTGATPVTPFPPRLA